MFKESFLKTLARKETVSLAFLKKQLREGRIVIPLNRKRKISKPCAVGEGLKVKINTNIGLSTTVLNIQTEVKKMDCAIKHGTDTIMDLSVSDNLAVLRKQLLKKSPVPFGTVPIYEIALEAKRRRGRIEDINFDDIWDVLKRQAEDGVDFFTIHAGILKKNIGMLKRKKRVGGIVSRGGALLAYWMSINKKENPFYKNFDKILQLAKAYNITLSLGDALRPGAISDSTDALQISELRTLGQLAKRCREKGVQVMIEGPGHIRLDEIAMNMMLEKKICSRSPFYVLGPLPTDIAAGYDHITSAIGGAIAALAGADFLCVVTPAEHLRHPTIDDIRNGVIASKIAAHSVDVLRFKDEWEKDRKLSLYRARRKWNKILPLVVDKDKVKEYRKKSKPSEDICAMCGNFCSLKIIEECNLLK